MANRVAIVVGATGLVGRHLVKQLLQDDDFTQVKTFSRSPLNINDSEKLSQHIVDFEDIAAWRHKLNGDTLFCCLGTTIKQAKHKEAQRQVDVLYPKRVAEAAHANGVGQAILVSSFGASHNSGSFYLRLKSEVEQAYLALGFDSLIIIRPSVLIGKRASFRFGEWLAGMLLNALSWLPFFTRYRPISGSQVATAMLKAAKRTRSGVNILELEKLQD